MDLGDRIRTLRAKQGLTLEEVGARVGVGKSTVRKWESGQIASMRCDKISLLSDALNVSPVYLMGWDDQTQHSVLEPIHTSKERTRSMVDNKKEVPMAKELMTDAEVEIEIERLKESDAVKLAQKERQYLYRRRQYMYTLRWYEKRGKELMAAGVTEKDFADSVDAGEGGEHDVGSC